MRISIVVYDIAVADRIKENTYKYFSLKTENTQDIIWIKDIYIEFQGRLIIINGNISDEILIHKYIETVCGGEEVTINSKNVAQYSGAYGKKTELMIKYT